LNPRHDFYIAQQPPAANQHNQKSDNRRQPTTRHGLRREAQRHAAFFNY